MEIMNEVWDRGEATVAEVWKRYHRGGEWRGTRS